MATNLKTGAIIEALNYADSLVNIQRFKEAKSLMCKMLPLARRVLGEEHRLTLKIRWTYAEALYKDDAATLEDLRAAVTTLEEIGHIARRVMGGAHPLTEVIELLLRDARATFAARETPEP